MIVVKDTSIPTYLPIYLPKVGGIRLDLHIVAYPNYLELFSGISEYLMNAKKSGISR